MFPRRLQRKDFCRGSMILPGIQRGIGPAEMAEAIKEGRRNRASKELAFHVLEVLDAILQSGADHTFHEIASTCERPEPLRNC